MHVGLLIILGAVTLTATSDTLLDDIWDQYKKVHGKEYNAVENTIRRKQWDENVRLIQKHNLEYDMGLHSFTLGTNQFADWSFEEYQYFMLGARQELAVERDSRLLFLPKNREPLPDAVDWRQKGYVTPVKNQAACGSCWAFSSTGALEGQHFRKTGKLASLSEQNLVDCVSKNLGCNGGWPDNSFDYVQANGGIDTEESYPYLAKDGNCTYKAADSGSTCKGHVDIPRGNESALQEAVATIGPISVAIDANHHNFMFYSGGIFYNSTCSHTASDHAVLVVGYGQENGYDFWLVKNSWTKYWGDQGYVKMARNCNNMCSIATHASYPLV